MTTSKVEAAIRAAEATANRAELRMAIRQNAPALDYGNAIQALNRERLAKAERDAAAAERADFERVMANVRADLAAERAWAERRRHTADLSKFTSAADASIARKHGGIR